MYTSSLRALPRTPIMPAMLIISSVMLMSSIVVEFRSISALRAFATLEVRVAQSPVECGQLRCRYCCFDGAPFLLSIVVDPRHPQHVIHPLASALHIRGWFLQTVTFVLLDIVVSSRPVVDVPLVLLKP